MAADIRWLEEANDDIQSILAYISFDNPKAGQAYIDAIARSCEKLSQFPETGRTSMKDTGFWLSAVILFYIDMTPAREKSP